MSPSRVVCDCQTKLVREVQVETYFVSGWKNHHSPFVRETKNILRNKKKMWFSSASNAASFSWHLKPVHPLLLPRPPETQETPEAPLSNKIAKASEWPCFAAHMAFTAIPKRWVWGFWTTLPHQCTHHLYTICFFLRCIEWCLASTISASSKKTHPGPI